MAEAKPSPAIAEPRPMLARTVTKRKIDSSLIEPCSPSSSPPPNIYELILDISKRAVVTAPVPECLLQSSPSASPFLVACDKGVVSVSHGTYAFNKFFELVDLAVSLSVARDTVIQYPKYVVQNTAGAIFLCMTKEECIALITRNETFQHCYVRRFVKSRGTKPVIYRISFRIDAGFSLFLIKNNRRVETMRRFTELRKDFFPMKQTSIYQHKATDFVYAGKLLKASFSPYLPYKSVLETHSAKVSPVLSPRVNREVHMPPIHSPQIHRKRSIENSLRELDFLVDTRDLHNCKVFAIEDHIPELEAIAEAFLHCLERGNKNKTVCSLVLDCVNSTDGEWFLQECVEMVWEDTNKQQRQAVDVKTKFRNLDRLRLDILDVKPADLPELFSATVQEGSGSPVRRTPMSSQRLRLYASEENLMKSHLETVQSKYDNLLTEARRSKILSRDLVADLASVHSTSQQIEQVLESSLLKFFPLDAQLPRKEFELKKEALLDVLSGKFRNLLKSTKVAMHKKLGMTSVQYESFLQVIVQEAKNANMPEASLERMTDRLNFFLL